MTDSYDGRLVPARKRKNIEFKVRISDETKALEKRVKKLISQNGSGLVLQPAKVCHDLYIKKLHELIRDLESQDNTDVA